MKKKEAFLLVFAIFLTTLAYFYSNKYAKETEERVKVFIEQKESNGD